MLKSSLDNEPAITLANANLINISHCVMRSAKCSGLKNTPSLGVAKAEGPVCHRSTFRLNFFSLAGVPMPGACARAQLPERMLTPPKPLAHGPYEMRGGVEGRLIICFKASQKPVAAWQRS